MVLTVSCPVLLLLLTGGNALRDRRKTSGPNLKLIAGVEVRDYSLVGRVASLKSVESRESDWAVVIQPGAEDSQIQAMCRASGHACNVKGNSSQGLSFFEMRGTELALESVLRSADPGAVKFVATPGPSPRYIGGWQPGDRTTCPEFSTGPDEWGDCKCDKKLMCWWELYPGEWLKGFCPYSSSDLSEHYSTEYFLPGCETCECWG